MTPPWGLAGTMGGICPAMEIDGRFMTTAPEVGPVTLKLQAALEWGACRWTSGVMAAIERTAPCLTHLELRGLDGNAFSGLEFISP